MEIEPILIIKSLNNGIIIWSHFCLDYAVTKKTNKTLYSGDSCPRDIQDWWVLNINYEDIHLDYCNKILEADNCNLCGGSKYFNWH